MEDVSPPPWSTMVFNAKQEADFRAYLERELLPLCSEKNLIEFAEEWPASPEIRAIVRDEVEKELAGRKDGSRVKANALALLLGFDTRCNICGEHH